MLRFMPVGDSMTIGSAGEHTWRYRMWQHLRATYGGPFQVVGPRETLYDKATATADSYEYADPDFPRAHLAGWGEGWQHLSPLIADAVRTSRADVLLVSLGLIDLGFYTNASQTAENVRAESDPPFARQVALFNDLLAKTVADLDEPASPLLLTSPPDAYDIHHDTYDGTHPNASGEHKLAAAFAEAMRQAWGVGGRYAHVPSTTETAGTV
jgi:hypothetical protein